MIRYLESENLLNKYAFVIEPTEQEKYELTKQGYCFFSGNKIQDTDDLNYGKVEEIWIK